MPEVTSRASCLNQGGVSWSIPRALTDAVCELMAASPSQSARRFDEAHFALAVCFGVKADVSSRYAAS